MSNPKEVISRFYAAEADYMNRSGATSDADFAAMAATLDPEVVLHQFPDLPWGGEFRGYGGYQDWARQMSNAFDHLEVKDQLLVVEGDTVMISCRLVTRSRSIGETLDLPMIQFVRVKGERIVEFRPFYWNVPASRAAVSDR